MPWGGLEAWNLAFGGRPPEVGSACTPMGWACALDQSLGCSCWFACLECSSSSPLANRCGFFRPGSGGSYPGGFPDLTHSSLGQMLPSLGAHSPLFICP